MKNSYFLSQPHQPLFLLAFFNAIVLMLIFMLSFKGVIELSTYPIIFHSYSLVYLFFTPAFLGFLFTTFPRFLATNPIDKSFYIRIIALFYIGSISFIAGSLISFIIYQIGILLIFIALLFSVKKLYEIHKSSEAPNKHDTFWILVGFAFGLLANILFIFINLDNLYLLEVAVQISIYLYLFLVAFSVGQRMIPFFSHCFITKNENFLKYVTILLIIHVALEVLYAGSSFFINLILAYIIGKELYRWKLPFPNPNPLLWILHIALYWIPIAFLLNAISSALVFFYDINSLYLGIHTLMIGFVFTVLIGFGTRVTIGHSGNMMFANKLTKFIFLWTQIVVLLRIVTSIVATSQNMNFMILFDISVTVWLVAFIVWLYQFMLVLISGKKI